MWNSKTWKWSFLYALLQTGQIMVLRCPSVRPSFPSVRLVLCPSVTVFHTFLLHDLNIELKFCMSLSCYGHSIKFEFRQFLSIFCWSYAPLEISILEIHSFPHFSSTCFDTLSWTLLYSNTDQFRMCVNVCRSYAFLERIILKIQSFPYVHKTLIHGTTDRFRVSSMCVNFCRRNAPFWNLKYSKCTVFCTFLLHALAYRAEICIWLSFNEHQIKFKCHQYL